MLCEAAGYKDNVGGCVRIYRWVTRNINLRLCVYSPLRMVWVSRTTSSKSRDDVFRCRHDPQKAQSREDDGTVARAVELTRPSLFPRFICFAAA